LLQLSPKLSDVEKESRKAEKQENQEGKKTKLHRNQAEECYFMLTVHNFSRQTNLGDRIQRADTFWSRWRGLRGRKSLSPGEGLLLVPCSGIHTLGMKISIDAIFLDAQGKVLKTVSCLKPNRLAGPVKSARMVLELPAGTIEQTATKEGDLLHFGRGQNN